MSTYAHWLQTWQMLDINAQAVPAAVYTDLIDAYSAAHRHYHTLQHLAECFDKFEEVSDTAEQPGEIRMALWFHDAVYNPKSSDNEFKSAQWAYDSALTIGVTEAVNQRIFDLIMVTCHHKSPTMQDAKILVDCDLAILGAKPERFNEYNQQIRAEYAFVAEPDYKAKRAEILQQFLARPFIFNTEHFIARYEAQARINIEKALSLLT